MRNVDGSRAPQPGLAAYSSSDPSSRLMISKVYHREPEQRGEVLKRRFRRRRQQFRVPDMRHVAPPLSHAANVYDPLPLGQDPAASPTRYPRE